MAEAELRFQASSREIMAQEAIRERNTIIRRTEENGAEKSNTLH